MSGYDLPENPCTPHARKAVTMPRRTIVSVLTYRQRRYNPDFGRSLRGTKAVRARWKRKTLYEAAFPFRLKLEYEDLRRPERWMPR